MVNIGELKQVSRAAIARLLSDLDFQLAPNAEASDEEFVKLLVRSGIRDEFVNTVAKQCRITHGDETDGNLPHQDPRAQALLYHLRGMSTDAIETQFDCVHETIVAQAGSSRLFTHPVDVAIDIHDWLFYGSKDTENVLTTKQTRGTTLAYRWATICALVDGVRFTLGWTLLPANDWRAKRQVVRSLIETAREQVSIRHAYLDRGFYQVFVVKKLNDLNVEYIVRVRPSKGMKDCLPEDAETVVADYEMQRWRQPRAREPVTVFAVPHTSDEDKHVWFVTNLAVTDETVNAYAAAFRRRWGVETSYRMIGDFLPKTSSPSFSVRLFYFSLAVTLYNLWVLVNLFVHPSIPWPRTPPISVGLFQQAIRPQLSLRGLPGDYG